MNIRISEINIPVTPLISFALMRFTQEIDKNKPGVLHEKHRKYISQPCKLKTRLNTEQKDKRP